MSRASSDRPNIVMIITHDTGQHLGCYGAGLATPAIDRLAESGVRCDNYFCTAAQCSPSRASIMTGRYPHNTGMAGLAHIGWSLHPDEKTLPMVLREAGCDTYLFGHQHEAEDPDTLGYDEVVPGKAAGDPGEGIESWKAANVAAAFAERVGDLARSDRPFFASIGFFETHRPFDLPGYDSDDPADVAPLYWLPDRPGIRKDIAGLNGLVYEVDRCVGEIVETLERAGLRENTLVIFTTDHGAAMPRAKGTCYDPGVKTAFIASLPGRFAPGVRGELLSNVDLLPTLCELARRDAPEGIEGHSFLPLLEGRPHEERDDVFLEMTWHDRYNPMRAVRTRRHKYIRNFGDRPLVYLPTDVYRGSAGEEMRDEYYATRRPEEELYDLASDPLERINLAGDPEYGGILESLRARVSDWMEATRDRLLEGDWPAPSQQLAYLARDKTPNA